MSKVPAVWGLVCFCSLLVGPLRAQDPVRPDTTSEEAPDTITVPIPPDQTEPQIFPREAPDTVVPDTIVPDSLIPAPGFPLFPQPGPTGWSAGVWVWEREALLAFPGVTLLDLLEQVPGVIATRAGAVGRPAGAAAFGLGGGRLRVFLDGYELDPLNAATEDLQRFGLVDLERVRVERDLAEVRIELSTFRLPDRRAYSQIVAGTGPRGANLLGGLFSTPLGERMVLATGFDLFDTEGRTRAETFTATTGFARASYAFGPETGVQAEYRQGILERTDPLFSRSVERRDLILRGRTRVGTRLALDAALGRSWQQPEDPDSVSPEVAVNQGSLRATYQREAGWISAGARFRTGVDTGFALPTADLSLRAGVRPLSGVTAVAEARAARADGTQGVEAEATLLLGPWSGLTVFASGATGDRVVSLALDSVGMEADTVRRFSVLSSSLAGVRAGAEWTRAGASLGAALLAVDADPTAPFGLLFDAGIAPPATEASTGVEAFLSVPLFVRPLRLEGWYTRWTDTGGRPYLPAEHGRLGLRYHDRFFGGNLEPIALLEAVRRGSAVTPLTGTVGFSGTSEPYTLLNFSLHLRILHLRGFLLVDNLLNTQAADLPGRPFDGQRVLYGFSWFFRN